MLAMSNEVRSSRALRWTPVNSPNVFCISIFMLGTAALPGDAAPVRHCTNSYGMTLDLSEDGPTLRMKRSEADEAWTMSLSNQAAFVATKSVTTWSRATRRVYKDKDAIEKDIHPVGARVNVLSLNKSSGLFSIVSVCA